MRVRAITLNLLHGAPLPGARQARSSVRSRLDWTAERLAEEAPDVVLLQEASRAAYDDTAARLADRLGMAQVYARANPAPLWRVARVAGRLVRALSFEEGPAILSRLPIVAHRVHRLSSALAIHERRIALEAVLEGPTGRFSVFSVHLTAASRAGRSARRQRWCKRSTRRRTNIRCWSGAISTPRRTRRPCPASPRRTAGSTRSAICIPRRKATPGDND
jgi:endonuclease/exonuclease/phosphatase family metal-dependent hydrolase